MANYMLFYWQAIDENGTYTTGTYLSNSSIEVKQRLLSIGWLPVHIKLSKTYGVREWQPQHKILLIRQLATLLKAGLPLLQGIKLIAKDHAYPCWQALLLDIQSQIEQGHPFSEVLSRWPDIFPPLYPALIYIGEVTGQLDECCFKLARQQEQQCQLQNKVRKALRYPLFIILFTLIVTICMLVFVLPEFVSIYTAFDAPLPAFTAVVIRLSETLQQSCIPLTMSITALTFFWRHQRKKRFSWQRKEQLLLLSLPVISTLYRGSQLSLIFTTLTLTQQAGLTLMHGLQTVQKTLNGVLWREEIVKLQKHIAMGKPLHLALKQHKLFTPFCYQLIKVGEEAGALDVLLEKLAQWHEANTHELADKLTTTLEPLLMAVVGIIVGVLVVAMYLPIFGLGDALT